MHHGFCRSNCERGNLTKDLPLVPGLSINSSGAIVQAQWWEDALCQPMTIAGALFSDNESTPSIQQNTKDNSPDRDDIWSTKLDMMLAVENATQLPQWIDFVSRSLQENEGNNGASSFASILSFRLDWRHLRCLHSFCFSLLNLVTIIDKCLDPLGATTRTMLSYLNQSILHLSA